MSKSDQDKLIGIHKYNDDSMFSEWLAHEDKPSTDRKKHRELQENIDKRSEAIKRLSEFIIEHHISNHRQEYFKRKKEILEKHDFKELIKAQKPFPTVDKTKKGNLTEIILAEYLRFTSELELLVYRLRYNPNVDQSMKGDDVLLFNLKDLRNKILKGEAKFRSSPAKSSIIDIIKACEGSKKMPLSISFVAEQLSNEGEIELSEALFDLNFEMHELKTLVVNVGLLLSNKDTSRFVEKHLDTDNSDFVFLSLGVDKAIEIIEESFELAIQEIGTQ